MLGREAILAQLSEGNLLVASDEANVRGASYDLRMAASRFVIFRSNGGFDRVEIEQTSTRVRYLNPGDYAIISTHEKLRLPAHIAGVVGSKFEVIRQGVLALTGINVDPGYGSGISGPQPLHFLLANMSDRAMPLHPGVTRVATIQFHDVGEGCFDPTVENALTNRPEIDEQFFGKDAPDLALKLFAGLAVLDEVRTTTEGAVRSIDSLRREYADLHGRVEGIYQGSQQVILFGIILIAVTITGVIASVLLQGGFAPSDGSDWKGLLAATGAVALFGVGAATLTWALWKSARKLATQVDSPRTMKPTSSAHMPQVQDQADGSR